MDVAKKAAAIRPRLQQPQGSSPGRRQHHQKHTQPPPGRRNTTSSTLLATHISDRPTYAVPEQTLMQRPCLQTLTNRRYLWLQHLQQTRDQRDHPLRCSTTDWPFTSGACPRRTSRRRRAPPAAHSPLPRPHSTRHPATRGRPTTAAVDGRHHNTRCHTTSPSHHRHAHHVPGTRPDHDQPGIHLTCAPQCRVAVRHPPTAVTRTAAHVSGLMCLTLIKLDERAAFRDWARTARIAASEAGDPVTHSWLQALAQRGLGRLGRGGHGA
jgi:hypothetical protein